jgi:para-aminobenzoate synthetase/4-amino-4-deoxychorismate lyase
MSGSNAKVIVAGPQLDGVWKLFEKAANIVAVHRPEDVLDALRQVEESVGKGLHAAGFITYEASPGLDRAMETHRTRGLPLLWFGLFTESRDIQVPDFPVSQSFRTGAWRASMPAAEYGNAVRKIKEYLKSGDTYQVNYSMRLNTMFEGDPLAFFWNLQKSQKARYSAFVETDDFAICSVSPELFFLLDGEELVSRPMKGTAKRGLTADQDMAFSRELGKSPKNQAENVMIVDMVRNDMGRVARPGSVTASSLFEIEEYPTVFQMVSTVECRTTASFVDIIRALFPCASITGAPKIRTMQIIKELESSPRGVYTGCIGSFSPGRKAQFSVGIRTVTVDKKQGTAQYGVGGGIVWDSDTESEYEECFVKAGVLSERFPDFCLLETILLDESGQYFLLDKHLARMGRSAGYFSFQYTPETVQEMLANEAKRLGTGKHKVRVRLERQGRVLIESEPIPAEESPWLVRLAQEPIDPQNVFLYHKTTNRGVYDQCRKAAGRCNDVLMWNSKRQLTESTMANIVIEKGGRLVTPPVESGLLPGVFREWLLEEGKIEEGVITVKDLRDAKKVFLINSVRKWIVADVNWDVSA